jgi:hypothetical protein
MVIMNIRVRKARFMQSSDPEARGRKGLQGDEIPKFKSHGPDPVFSVLGVFSIADFRFRRLRIPVICETAPLVD